VLETDFETDTGAVTVTDCMPVNKPCLIRLVEGKRGTVPMRTELTMRFDYGSVVPWVQRAADGVWAIGGPGSVRLRTSVPVHSHNEITTAEFAVAEGQRVPFTLAWNRSHEEAPPAVDAEEAVRVTTAWWRQWSSKCTYVGPHRDKVMRSLITLK